MSEFWRLVNDPRTWEAIDDLLDRGLCEDMVWPLLHRIARLPEIHKSIATETADDRKDRRMKLAHKILMLAAEIDDDPEARHYRVMDHENYTDFPALDWRMPDGRIEHREYPTIANYLRQFADGFSQSTGASDLYNEWTEGKRTTHNDLSAFARREVAAFLDRNLRKADTKPITAATNLVNALLGSGGVTYEQMKETFRHLHRKSA